MTPAAPLPTRLEARLLFPFTCTPRHLAQAAERLCSLTHVVRRGAVPVWTRGEPGDLYRQESTEPVRGLLFPPAHAGVGVHYLRLNPDHYNTWLKHGVTARHGERERYAIDPVPERGSELFLTPDGVGVLSIAVGFIPGGTRGDYRQWAYRLFQLSRPVTVPHVGLPPANHPEAPPPADAPLAARLGKAGGDFTWGESSTICSVPWQAPPTWPTSAPNINSPYTRSCSSRARWTWPTPPGVSPWVWPWWAWPTWRRRATPEPCQA